MILATGWTTLEDYNRGVKRKVEPMVNSLRIEVFQMFWSFVPHGLARQFRAMGDPAPTIAAQLRSSKIGIRHGWTQHMKDLDLVHIYTTSPTASLLTTEY